MAYLINIFNPSFLALGPLSQRSLVGLASLLFCCARLLRVSISTLPGLGLLTNLLRLLGVRLNRCCRELIDELLHILSRALSLASPSLFQDFLGISKVLLWREYLVDGICGLVHVDMLRYKLTYGLFGSLQTLQEVLVE